MGIPKRRNLYNQGIDNWSWKLIWRTKLPTKVVCFTWSLGQLYMRHLSQDNLKKRKIQFPNRCYRCKKEAETILLKKKRGWNHPTSSSLWGGLKNMEHVFCLFGFNWPHPSQLRMLMRTAYGELTKSSRRSRFWYLLAFFWCNWLERSEMFWWVVNFVSSRQGVLPICIGPICNVLLMHNFRTLLTH